MDVDETEKNEEEEFRSGPLSVLTNSVKTNSQVCILLRKERNYDLLFRFEAHILACMGWIFSPEGGLCHSWSQAAATSPAAAYVRSSILRG